MTAQDGHGAGSRPAGLHWVPTGVGRLFASDALVRVLGSFVLAPDRRRYQREIARLTGLRLSQVQRSLRALEEAGLVAAQREGRNTYYSSVLEHPIWGDLAGVWRKGILIGQWLAQALAPAVAQVEMAFVFGSFASGEIDARSDLDIAIVGGIGLKRASELLGPVEDRSGRDVDPMVFSVDRFTELARANDHFVRGLIDGPKVWIIGDDAAMGAMLER